MASNIKIIGNILDTSTVERYSEEDIKLISSKKRQELFGGKNDYIEYFIFDIADNLLNVDYNYLDYKLPSSSFLSPAVSITPNTTDQIQTTDVGVTSTEFPTGSSIFPIIEIDPIQDLQDLGYSSGEFRVRYNFFERKISNNIDQELFVKEISRDRTEIRLGSVTLTDEQIESGSLALIDKINNTEEYYVDYILNFGDNQQFIAVNVALNKDPEGYEILFKLYQPLPLEIQEKQTLWVVEEKVFPYTFDINLDRLVTPPPPPTLRGPNFNIEIEGQGTIATAYNNYSNLISSLQSLQSSSYNQIQSLITSQSIDINVDYSNFNNFVFFGSAYRRVINFYNKVKEIEFYQSEINTLGPTAATTASLQTTLNQYSASINRIIAEFDGLEYYLYYNSGSSLTLPDEYSITPYPKSSSLLPYTLLPSSNSTVITWYNHTLENALSYDRDNTDNLEYAIPLFVRDDEKNQPFLLFLNMVGHYFDNIWIYLKAVTDINLANNNLEYGISRDLVYQQLKSLGIKLYNSQAGENVDQYLIGANTGSATWDGDFTITGSYLNNIPRKDLVSELYKRIYHNLPLLLKTKGTVAGLNNLMTTFGISNRDYYTIYSGSNYETFYTPTGSSITSSILNVKEFGGSLKSELINGYNNDKVRILPNNIVGGNILSPLKSLQEYPTASSEFRDDDLHYVDISFSPQTQIDTYVSGVIASVNPTWNIDNYIGDPRHLYSGSYPDLDTQRILYYQTGSGFPGFTSSLLDYNGFIRLIEFFDNSLFKMLNDFVPERTSLSTGVTINSPVLERNKVTYSKPTVITQSAYEANYDVVGDISTQYGTFYNALSDSNNTEAWYDGVISGSVVDVNQYFEDNYNPYLENILEPVDPSLLTLQSIKLDQNTISTSITFNGNNKNGILVQYRISFRGGGNFGAQLDLISPTQSAFLQPGLNNVGQTFSFNFPVITVYGSIFDSATTFKQIVNEFKYSDFNTTLNNVFDNTDSQYRRKIEYFYGTTRSITYPAELQDSYLSLDSYNNSRYKGSKTISLTYNTYTSGTFLSEDKVTFLNGDKSFGKTSAIDHTVRKIGLFTRIESNQFLPKRNNVSLKYLVDEFGELTELNQLNINWKDVQRTFVANESTTVTLFDNKKFGNQKFTDGVKPIFDSGYNYYPILYMVGCSSSMAGKGIPLSFELTGDNAFSSFITKANNIGFGFISGSSPITYPFFNDPSGSVIDKGVGNLYKIEQVGPEFFTTGTINTYPTYSVEEGGFYNISATLPFYFSLPAEETSLHTWGLEIWRKKALGGGLNLLAREAVSFEVSLNSELYWRIVLNTNNSGNTEAQFTWILSRPLRERLWIQGGFDVELIRYTAGEEGTIGKNTGPEGIDGGGLIGPTPGPISACGTILYKITNIPTMFIEAGELVSNVWTTTITQDLSTVNRYRGSSCVSYNFTNLALTGGEPTTWNQECDGGSVNLEGNSFLTFYLGNICLTTNGTYIKPSLGGDGLVFVP